MNFKPLYNHLLLAILGIFTFAIAGMGQTTIRHIPRVPYASQQNNNWCYAACIKMILDFHDGSSNTVSQCEIAKTYVKYKSAYWYSRISSTDCCTCSPLDCNGNTPGILYSTIPFSHQAYNGEIYQHDYCIDIFEDFGFHARQIANRQDQPMSWDRLKREIDNCNPFLLFIDPDPFEPEELNSLNGNHVVLVNGYKETPNGDNAFLFLDPWSPCSDQQTNGLVPYEVMSGRPTNENPQRGGESSLSYFVNSVLSIVHSIYPYNNASRTANCTSCSFLESVYQDTIVNTTSQQLQQDSSTSTLRQSDKSAILNPESSTLLDLLVNHADQIAAYSKFVLNRQEYASLLTSSDYIHAPVKYTSTQKLLPKGFLDCLFPPRKLEKVTESDYQITDIVSFSVDTNLVSTLQKDDNEKWHLRGIFQYTNIKRDRIVQIEGSDKQYTLSNEGVNEATEGSKEYILVKTRPLPYEFLSFSNDSKNYLTPAKDYPDLNLTEGTAYKEEKVIKKLQKKIRQLKKDEKVFLKDKPLGIRKSNKIQRISTIK